MSNSRPNSGAATTSGRPVSSQCDDRLGDDDRACARRATSSICSSEPSAWSAAIELRHREHRREQRGDPDDAGRDLAQHLRLGADAERKQAHRDREEGDRQDARRRAAAPPGAGRARPARRTCCSCGKGGLTQLDDGRRRLVDRQRQVAGEDDRAAAPRVLGDDAGEQLDAGGVEGVEGLVEQPGQQLALRRQARQGDAPALALRQGAHEGVLAAGHAEALERGVDVAAVDVVAAEVEQEAERLGDASGRPSARWRGRGRAAAARPRGAPAQASSPAAGADRPARVRSSVVLPWPLAPRIQTIAPAPTREARSARTGRDRRAGTRARARSAPRRRAGSRRAAWSSAIDASSPRGGGAWPALSRKAPPGAVRFVSARTLRFAIAPQPRGDKMLFGKLLPREGNFFELFNQHGAYIAEGARAFIRLIQHYADPELRDKHANEVGHAERQADRITAEVNRLLHKTFITPIDREQIHGLINAMDDILDLLQDASETMSLYDVQAMNDDILRLGDMSAKCCERVQHAVSLLPRISEPDVAEAALKTCEEIDRLESDADRVMRSAMSRLFREEKDVRELIKLQAIYELLESISDRCEDVANLIEGVVLENS